MAHKRKPDDEAAEEVAGNSRGASRESSRIIPRQEKYPNNAFLTFWPRQRHHPTGSVHATHSAPQHPTGPGAFPRDALRARRAYVPSVPLILRPARATEFPPTSLNPTIPFLRSGPTAPRRPGVCPRDVQRAAAPLGARGLTTRRPARAARTCRACPALCADWSRHRLLSGGHAPVQTTEATTRERNLRCHGDALTC